MNRTLTTILVLELISALGLNAAHAADKTPTLKSLESREVTIEPSKPTPVDAQTQLKNFRRLLELTQEQKPQTRIPIMLRLADAELDAATDDADPKVGARRAVDLYKTVQAQDEVKVDRANLLYNLARAYDLAGNTDDSAAALSALISKYPDSKLVPEAQFRRAETYFVQRKYSDAENDYAALVQRGDNTPFYLQSRYKLGWTRYKLSQYKASLNEFASVLKSLVSPSDVAADGSIKTGDQSKANQQVVQDSLRGITLNFAQLSKDMQPGEYIDQHGLKPYEFLIYKNLLAHYKEQQRFTDASDTALAFAQRNPDHPEAKAFELEAIAALENGGFPSLARARKESFVQRYGVERQSWYGKDPLDVPKVNKLLRGYLDEITQTYHAKAQKTHKPEDYQQAAKWYATYLKIFPKIDEAPEIAFRRGDVLFDAGEYTQSAQQYEQVGYDMGQNDKAADAAYAAVLAWRKAAGASESSDPNVEKSTLRFAKTFATDKHATEVLARLAEDRYQNKDLPGASALAKRVIEHEPAAPKEQLANAWRIRAAAAEQAKDYPAVETALGWLLTHGEAQQKAQAREALAASIYKQGEALVKAGDDAGAQKQFLRLQKVDAAKGSGADAIRATALFDAAAASVRAGNKPEAINLLERFRNKYPKHKLASEATHKLAELYLATGNKTAAAREFVHIRDQGSADAQTRREAALQAAQLYAQTGETANAINAYEAYLRHHNPSFSDAMEARNELVELNTKLNRLTKADSLRKRIITADAKAGTARNERSKTLAANATLHFAEQTREKFDAASLYQPLKRSLKAKKALLDNALSEYGKAADYNIATVTTAATFRIGQLYYDFSRALLNSPRPSNLSTEELAQYETLLEEQAFPLEEQAIKIHEANVTRISNGIYDKWVQKSLAQLAKLVPVRFAKKEKLSNAL